MESYCNTLTFCCRECLERRCQKNKKKVKEEDNRPCSTGENINASLETAKHNYFVLENHTKANEDDDQHLANNDQAHYAFAQDPTYNEATDGVTDDYYDTTGQGRPGRAKPVNVYNTFKDFQQHDDYDHIGDKKNTSQIMENDYNTTQAAMSSTTEDDTYNHLNQGPLTSVLPDNVYGMPRAGDDYDRMPPVSGTTAGVKEN